MPSGSTGVVAIVAPQESPLLGLVNVIAPALVAGNTVVVIASERYPLPAMTFAEVLATSDVPKGVVNILTGSAAEMAPWLASHADVDGLDLTGAGDLDWVDLEIAALAVDVESEAGLAGQADEGEILAVEVGVEDPVLARRLEDVVEAAVGVLLQLAKVGQVELVTIVGERAEQSRAEVVVGEDEAAKVRDEGLDADARRNESIASAPLAAQRGATQHDSEKDPNLPRSPMKLGPSFRARVEHGGRQFRSVPHRPNQRAPRVPEECGPRGRKGLSEHSRPHR